MDKIGTTLMLVATVFAVASSTCTKQARPTVCEHFAETENESYLTWYEDYSIAANYPRSTFLPSDDPARPQDGAAFHWKIVLADEVESSSNSGSAHQAYIHFAIAARAKGWLGLGLTETGGMLGADMALLTANNPDKLIDAYTLGEKIDPFVDSCQQDWELLASNVVTDDGDGSFIMFESRRRVNTTDPQDRVIFNDGTSLTQATHKIIAAWGNQPEVSFHGMNRARGGVRFFSLDDDIYDNDAVESDLVFASEADLLHAKVEAQGAKSFRVGAKAYKIEAMRTVYKYFCVSKQNLIDQGVPDTQEMLGMIGFEPIISPATRTYVHHFLIRGSRDVECDAKIDRNAEILYAWAAGEEPFILPDNMAMPLFGSTGHQSFVIEIHYDNPSLQTGDDLVDNSGVHIYWTEEPREHQVGILTVGDPLFSLSGEPVGDGLSRHNINCPAACTSTVLGDKSVTVLRDAIHMHATGIRGGLEQTRDRAIIRNSAVDFFQFEQSGAPLFHKQDISYTIEPGDSFRVSCYYNGDNSTTFGSGAENEMCVGFLYYYPKVEMEVFGIELPWSCGCGVIGNCRADHEFSPLNSTSDLGRSFGASLPDDQCQDKHDSGASSTSSMKGLPILTIGLLSLFALLHN